MISRVSRGCRIANLIVMNRNPIGPKQMGGCGGNRSVQAQMGSAMLKPLLKRRSHFLSIGPKRELFRSQAYARSKALRPPCGAQMRLLGTEWSIKKKEGCFRTLAAPSMNGRPHRCDPCLMARCCFCSDGGGEPIIPILRSVLTGANRVLLQLTIAKSAQSRP